jgi:MFS family permease
MTPHFSFSKNPEHPTHYHDFVCLTLGRLFGMLGVSVLSVAIGWHVYELTNDPLAIGLVGLSQFIPSLLLVLFAGHFADRYSRSRIIVATNALMAIAAGTLMILTFLGTISVHAIYMVAVFLGVARIFGGPAAQAILPNVIPQSVFSRAVAVNSLSFQIAVIGGPALAGFAFYMGITAVYTLSFLLILTATLLYVTIRIRNAGEKRPFTMAHLFAGLNFILSKPIMLGAISLDLFAVLFGGVIALLPVYAKDILDVGPQGLGLLRSAPALGAALMSFVLAKMAFSRNIGPKIGRASCRERVS